MSLDHGVTGTSVRATVKGGIAGIAIFSKPCLIANTVQCGKFLHTVLCGAFWIIQLGHRIFPYVASNLYV